MKTYGLIGYPLTHSFSQRYFTAKFKKEGIEDCNYKLFSIKNILQINDVVSNNPTLLGLNVTIPHKEKVIPFLDSLDKVSSKIRAVNAIKINRNTTDGIPFLTGYNTDAYGFEKSLKPLLRRHHRRALILGTGGASKAVSYVLNSLGIEFLYVSRTGGYEGIINYKDIDKNLLDGYEIIVNCSPAGMYPKVETSPDLPYEHINHHHILFDLVYNPAKTLFMEKGAEKGAKVKNGLQMLKYQAEKSWEIWNEGE